MVRPTTCHNTFYWYSSYWTGLGAKQHGRDSISRLYVVLCVLCSPVVKGENKDAHDDAFKRAELADF